MKLLLFTLSIAAALADHVTATTASTIPATGGTDSVGAVPVDEPTMVYTLTKAAISIETGHKDDYSTEEENYIVSSLQKAYNEIHTVQVSTLESTHMEAESLQPLDDGLVSHNWFSTLTIAACDKCEPDDCDDDDGCNNEIGTRHRSWEFAFCNQLRRGPFESLVSAKKCKIEYKSDGFEIVSKDYLTGPPSGFVSDAMDIQYAVTVGDTRQLTVAEERFLANAIVDTFNSLNDPAKRVMLDLSVKEEKLNPTDFLAAKDDVDADVGFSASSTYWYRSVSTMAECVFCEDSDRRHLMEVADVMVSSWADAWCTALRDSSLDIFGKATDCTVTPGKPGVLESEQQASVNDTDVDADVDMAVDPIETERISDNDQKEQDTNDGNNNSESNDNSESNNNNNYNNNEKESPVALWATENLGATIAATTEANKLFPLQTADTILSDDFQRPVLEDVQDDFDFAEWDLHYSFTVHQQRDLTPAEANFVTNTVMDSYNAIHDPTKYVLLNAHVQDFETTPIDKEVLMTPSAEMLEADQTELDAAGIRVDHLGRWWQPYHWLFIRWVTYSVSGICNFCNSDNNDCRWCRGRRILTHRTEWEDTMCAVLRKGPFPIFSDVDDCVIHVEMKDAVVLTTSTGGVDVVVAPSNSTVETETVTETEKPVDTDVDVNTEVDVDTEVDGVELGGSMVTLSKLAKIGFSTQSSTELSEYATAFVTNSATAAFNEVNDPSLVKIMSMSPEDVGGVLMNSKSESNGVGVVEKKLRGSGVSDVKVGSGRVIRADVTLEQCVKCDGSGSGGGIGMDGSIGSAWSILLCKKLREGPFDMLSMVEGCFVSMEGVGGVESTGMGVETDVE